MRLLRRALPVLVLFMSLAALPGALSAATPAQEAVDICEDLFGATFGVPNSEPLAACQWNMALINASDDGSCRRLGPVLGETDDRVLARVAGERAPKLTLGNAERMRRLAAPVEDAGHEAFVAQAPCVGGAAALARLDLELDSFSGHFGAQV